MNGTVSFTRRDRVNPLDQGPIKCPAVHLLVDRSNLLDPLTTPRSTDPTAARQLSNDLVNHWATLIANAPEIPSELRPVDQEQLLLNVRRLLLSRMIAFVGRRSRSIFSATRPTEMMRTFVIKRDFNPTKPYRFVRYARTSSSNQSQKSLDQQLAAIDEMIARDKCPSRCVMTYGDGRTSDGT